MIAHLSSEQLSECILGQPSPMVAQHVLDCAACRAEVATFHEALGEFRGAVRVWSEDQARAVAAIPSVSGQRAWAASHQLAFALLIAVVCILASFVLPRPRGESAPGSDVLLLNQVDAQVSRTVPASMEPLMKLVAQQ